MAGENRERNERLARRAGFASYQEYREAMSEKRFRPYQYWIRIAAENLSAETGLDFQEALREVRRLDSEFHRRYGRAARSNFAEGNPDYEGKAMFELLVYLRLRFDEEWWGVGDTYNLK